MTLERIHVTRPEPAKLNEPLIHFLKRFRLQPIESALGVHSGFDEACIPQHSQVLGDCRLGHAKSALDRSNRLLGRSKEAQYRAAVRLRKYFERSLHEV